jgi:diguanylate cyclase (GGDEF)-like protein
MDGSLGRRSMTNASMAPLVFDDRKDFLLPKSVIALGGPLDRRELLRMVLTDDLTGLHNRRGFRMFADEHFKIASRADKHLLLFLADLDSLKQINDNFGHAAGDRALVLAAQSFKKTFRRSDLTARLGGDEFAALTIEGPGRSAAAICQRLHKNLAQCAAQDSRFRVSLSVGVARFEPQTAPASLQQLLGQADHALYGEKRSKRALATATATAESTTGIAAAPPSERPSR